MRHVGVLKLIHADIAEAFLVRLANIGIVLEEQHRLHDDVVKIQRVGFTQDLLICFVNARGLFETIVSVRFHGEVIGRHQLVLGAADLIHHCLHGE